MSTPNPLKPSAPPKAEGALTDKEKEELKKKLEKEKETPPTSPPPSNPATLKSPGPVAPVKGPKSNREWRDTPAAEVQNLINKGIVQASDVPISHEWWQWRQDQ